MVYLSMDKYSLLGYGKSRNKKKKYDAVLINKKNGKIIHIPFGDVRYENFGDKTGLDLYKTHNDIKRRDAYRARHKKDLRKNFYSPGFFSYNILW